MEVTLQELIDFHTKGAISCEAYAKVDDDSITLTMGKNNKFERTSQHYSSRAEWHRGAVKTLEAAADSQFILEGLQK